MKVYIATRFDCWRDASRARDQLLLAGHVVTSRWIDVARELDGVCEAVPIGDPRRAANAQMDLDDLSEAEAILVLVPISGGTGMWLELGYALGTGKRVVMAGPARERTIFADLSDVKVFEEVYDAIAAFGGGDPGPAMPAHQSTDRERARHQVEHLRNILASIMIDLTCEDIPPGHDRSISLTAAAHSLAITLARIEVAERSRGAEPADVRLDVAMDDVEEGDA